MQGRFCNKCGGKIDDSALYCPNCGEKIRRRNGKSNKNNGVQVSKVMLIFVIILVLCTTLIAVIVNKMTGVVFKNKNGETITDIVSSQAPKQTGIETAQPKDEKLQAEITEPVPEKTEEPTPTPKPTKTPEPKKKDGNYKNSRYGYSVTYPADVFTSSSSSDNGDGIVLYGDDIVVSVYGGNNTFSESLDEVYNNAVETSPGVSYKTKKSNFYVISGINEDKIYYTKEYVGIGSTNTLLIEYPSSKKKQFDSVVTQLANSFKPGNINQPN